MVDMSSSMAEKPACCLRGCGGRGGWARNLHAVDPRLARPQRGRISPHDHPTGMAAYRRCRSGRLGGYFGGMLSRAGAPVAMIGRQTFADAVKRNGLFLDTLEFQEMVRPEAAAEMSAARGAEVLLFCVKTTDTETAARELAPFLSPHGIVVSMQNGLDNAERIRTASGMETLPAAVYVAASVPEPGRIKHVGRGDLVIGPQSERTQKGITTPDLRGRIHDLRVADSRRV